MVRRMTKQKSFLGLFIIITAIIVILDQVLKYLVLVYQPQWSWGLLTIHYLTNTGAGFGILQGQTVWLLIASAMVTLGFILYYNHLPKEKWVQVLSALFLGGVIGNLLDRFFRKEVIDFIDFSYWPAFNVADASITVAAIGLIVYFWKK